MINNLSDVEKATKIVSTETELPKDAIFGSMCFVLDYKTKGSTIVMFDGNSWVEI